MPVYKISLTIQQYAFLLKLTTSLVTIKILNQHKKEQWTKTVIIESQKITCDLIEIN